MQMNEEEECGYMRWGMGLVVFPCSVVVHILLEKGAQIGAVHVLALELSHCLS